MAAQSFGSYEVLDLVAEGSTGTVYRARHVELARVVAIKELNRAMLEVPGMRARLRAEAETLARLADPHVVEVYDYVEDSDHAWIAEEWVEGASLETILHEHGALTPEQSVGVVRDAVLGLARAHELDLVHRDVSSRNILADMQGSSKLVDFGLAGPSGEPGVFGTPAFMSPEATTGGSLTKRSDVYSTAAVLYTLLAGQVPYTGRDVASVLRSHREDPVPELQDHGTDLRDLLRRSLAKDPADRPADASAFLQELEEAAKRRFGATWLQRASIGGVVAGLAGAPVAVGSAGGTVPSAAPTVLVDAAAIATGTSGRATRASRKTLVLGAAAALVVVGGLVAAVAMSGGSDAEEPNDSGPTAAVPDTAEAEPDGPTVAERLPGGKYRFTLTRISSTYPDPGPKRQSVTWTLKLGDCSTSACSGKVASSSGSKFNYQWNGSALRIEIKGGNSETYVGPCVDEETGEEVPGSKGRVVTTVAFAAMRPVAMDDDGIPTRYEGTTRRQTTYEGISQGCRDLPRDKATHQMTLTRIS